MGAVYSYLFGESPFDASWPAYEEKMRAEGLSNAAIAAFKYNFKMLTSGANLMIPGESIQPVESLPDYASLTTEYWLVDPVHLRTTGGLGTGMGLEKAKSLLDLKEGRNFLDFIALQAADGFPS
ncbi:hypothetical protein EMIHUDRAFT_238347 [Emiliania huxleyi CCMP1516]|uniref:Uncharacterized protein n=2 Tax=Emiliania huxleyi TaxID=2903 RepID=A0A0D3JML6_EMIH1|nr:hypothetical protein EMIHUDRAFT_238347 [Emiliania huxleyi CCMP1516]EOD24751.1 hypothetical protein EMIHUDRAFT_238347 [Emiliania huxleyi CCMP1516]|eukprot:XP_005777180.1 hypothetical protein EMIHUDRAFT_238347 [Emiliania huxleyi CCMP1516]